MFFMKHIFFLLGILMFSLFQPPTVDAQTGFFVKTNQRNTGASTIYSRDTLSGLDTVIVDLITNDYRNWTADVIIRCDSISGATAGSAILQYASDDKPSLTANQVMWYPVSTVTLDGAGRTQYRLTGDLTSRRARVFFVTPNATARKMMITYVATMKQKLRY